MCDWLIKHTIGYKGDITYLIFAEINFVFGASKMLGIEKHIEAKSHAPNRSTNPILINLLMFAKALKGKSQLKVTSG